MMVVWSACACGQAVAVGGIRGVCWCLRHAGGLAPRAGLCLCVRVRACAGGTAEINVNVHTYIHIHSVDGSSNT